MKYIVYLTTNLVNRYIYIGVHQTETPETFDGYYGCGIYRHSSLKNPKTKFQYALKHYGFDKFERRTLKIFNTAEEAYALEAQLVNEEFIRRPDTYNMLVGGTYPNPEKPVYQYSLEGQFLNGWPSVTKAAKELNVTSTLISQAAVHNTTSMNSLWSFSKLDQLDITEYIVYKPEIQLFLYDSEGQFYKTFPSYSKLASELNTSTSHITRAIKCGYKIKGYYITTEYTDEFKIPELSSKVTGLVHQYTLDGVYIRTYNTIKEVENIFKEKMQGINPSIKQHKQYKGYLWSRGPEPITMKAIKVSKGLPRQVGQYTLDGQLVTVFKSVREARQSFKSVDRVLKGLQHQCGGYTFKYISQ